MLQGFRACTVLLIGYFLYYCDTEYYFHMNIPAVNTGMLLLIETYHSDRSYPYQANVPFLPPEKFRKLTRFLKFTGGKK